MRGSQIQAEGRLFLGLDGARATALLAVLVLFGRSDAARVVIVFTDASFKETMDIAEAKGGSLQDVANVIMANRVILSLFAPNFEGYDRLSQIDKSEWEVVEFEGLNPQQALQKFTSDPVNFRNTLKQLAASVSRSAETVAL